MRSRASPEVPARAGTGNYLPTFTIAGGFGILASLMAVTIARNTPAHAV